MPVSQLPERARSLVRLLGQARRRGRTAHACLVIGDRLESLQELAMTWAQTCICSALTPDSMPCGTCPVCRQFEHGTYPFLYQLRPQSKSRMIGIDTIRELEHRLYLTSNGMLKIGMIQEADRLTEQAQNAFLKTLEEPPPNTLLVLITVSPSALLPTILSRCQLVSMLDNRVVYTHPDVAALVQVLASMRRGTGAQTAFPAGDYLVGALKEFDQRAKANVADEVARLKASFENVSPAERKRLEEVIEAVEKAEYLRLRELFLSTIHAWFAQQYLRANGIEGAQLPNPELFAPFGESLPDPPSVPDALRSLRLTEAFIDSIGYNVDEGLALHDFCQKVCAKV